MTDYEGRTVVVTGGTGALGTAVVGELLARGARCHVVWRSAEERDAFPHGGSEGVSLHGPCELTDASAVRDLYDEVPVPWASVHIAGGFAMGGIADTSVESFRGMMEANATSCFLCCREAIRRMREGGAGGRLVNVSAKPALVPMGLLSAYGSAKGAVATLTQGLAEELADEGIWVNAVVPSIMNTPANREAMPKADHGRWADVDDVAGSVGFLASPDNRVTRGALVPVYGRG